MVPYNEYSEEPSTNQSPAILCVSVCELVAPGGEGGFGGVECRQISLERENHWK